ncbi:ABC transporter permease [Brevundimonas vitis]|uniref:ABC transporter permease n=1 Tax=Brevundimonas vitisensis TaxID=2800818 RepID=A0ABX7BM73_9CAUL|nr:ABC transporter permease [Brevundimonas vitisensis]QQQ17973.1 ABC transporter permease [Brevundimonas vitisensis]
MIPRWFPSGRSLIARDRAGEGWLIGLIAVLSLLACLAAAGGVAAERAASGWSRALRTEATVQVRPRVGETGDAAAARAAETLSGLDGVQEAAVLDRAAAEALLRPWLGEAALPDLPLPYLVTVRLDTAQPASAVSLSRALAEAGLDASVDDHSLWREEVERSAAWIAALALAVFCVTAGAAAVAVIYATRTGLAAQAETIEVLSLHGATPNTIAAQFQQRYGLLAGAAGAIAAAASAFLILVLRMLGGSEGLIPALPLTWSDIILVSPTPLVAATVALVTARVTVLRRLR